MGLAAHGLVVAPFDVDGFTEGRAVMAPLSAGARDRLVTIQQLTESKGASNYPVETWSALTQVWAAKRDAKGIERFVHSADQQSAPYDTTWELPYSVNWDPELVNVPKTRRLVVKGRVHDIVAANEVGRKRAVELMTLAGGLLE